MTDDNGEAMAVPVSDTDDTQYAPTVQAPPQVPWLAWSQDTQPETQTPQRESWRSTWAAAGVIVICCAVTLILVFAIDATLPKDRAQQQVPAQPTRTPCEIAPGALICQTPEPTPGPATPALSEQDSHFLQTLNHFDRTWETDPAAAIREAHDVCDDLASHPQLTRNGANEDAQVRDSISEHAATYLLAAAVGIYCPQFSQR